MSHAITKETNAISRKISLQEPLARTISGCELADYEEEFIPMPDQATKFTLRNLTGLDQDIEVEMLIDNENEKVEWFGLPIGLQ